MGAFIDFFKSVDAFGEPVTVNYAGESNFKTIAGALLTIAFKCFMIIYCFTQCLIVFNYDDPIIS